MRLESEQILSGSKHALLTTWGNKYNPVIPSISKCGATIKLSTADITVELNSFDEIILTIILKFLFMPVWLIKQCYEDVNIVSNDIFNNGKSYIDNMIDSWIKIGIIWKEDSVTGQYVRPTYALFNLFGESPYTYTNIPFNTLTHTISEEKVMFDVMSGKSEILKKEKSLGHNLLPRISELGFDPNVNGTNIIAEEDFRNPILYTQNGIDELNKIENEIDEIIKNKGNISPELENFRYFVIAKKINSTGYIKRDYDFHVPDLAIPALRVDGKPMSIAIEVELTNKRANAYVESLRRYKGNNKFGSVYWLCKDSGIGNAIKTAYEEIGGCGTCSVMLLEFVIPSPKY